jgi:hypothetical protein
MFKIDPSEIIQLDDYFLEYFIRLLKRLRDINFEDVQRQKKFNHLTSMSDTNYIGGIVKILEVLSKNF